MEGMQQCGLFDDFVEPGQPQPKRRRGGSSNPIVFHDYESYVAKFQGKEKTTDDTFTPPDVFEAVVKYVGEVYDLSGKEILRPFYPGGDYENAEYPSGGVVIDNPPFSMFMKICRFFSERGIPFFIFGPGLTISSCCKYCTAVIAANNITYENKAKVNTNYASNLFGDTAIMTAPRLSQLIAACPSQMTKANLPKYRYPDEVLSVSDMATICRGGIDFRVGREECRIIRDLDNLPKKGGLFGDHLLLSVAKGKAKEDAKGKAKEVAKGKAKEEAMRAIPVPLSARERGLRLGIPSFGRE